MLDGVTVIELAEWGMVPSCGAVLADWGAAVIKIEHPGRGDPMRGLITGMVRGVPFMIEQLNRGKRDIALDVGHPEGYEILCRLVEGADVFLTNFLEPARKRLRVDDETLAGINPRLVYALAHGQGQRGPDADKAGFDAISYWARGGIGYKLSPPGGAFVDEPPAFGDLSAGLSLAGGIAAALYRRSVSGQGGRVDVSLLNVAVWTMAPDILLSHVVNKNARSMSIAAAFRNPLVGVYRTSDDRLIKLNMIQSDRYWPGLCKAIERPELIADEAYADIDKRAANFSDLESLLQKVFAARSLADWAEPLDRHECVWDPVRSPVEIPDDPQVKANGYLIPHPTDPRTLLAANPVQYNHHGPDVQTGAPEFGQHTEEILQELGLDWDRITALKDAGVIN